MKMSDVTTFERGSLACICSRMKQNTIQYNTINQKLKQNATNQIKTKNIWMHKNKIT